MRSVRSTNNRAVARRLLRARLFPATPPGCAAAPVPTAHCPPPTNHRCAAALVPTAYSLQPVARRAARRGVLLLVCLSLLVLFAVIAITFVMVAGQYRRGSRAEASHERYGDDFRKQLDSAFGQVVRDTQSSMSAIRNHGLLPDMYGDPNVADGILLVQGQLATAPSLMPTGAPGQIVELSVTNATNLSPFAGYYNGCTLTIISGQAAVQTTRIVGYRPGSTAVGTFRVLAFANGILPQMNDRLIINGRPFIGAGFGYNSTTGQLNAMDGTTSNPLALLPHHRYVTAGNPAALANPHEDYDAPDPQNMALAYVTPRATTSDQIIPSFHRPDLVKYWMNSSGATDWNTFQTSSPDLARKIVLRPLVHDHPSFANVNPSFNPITGPWDVDNDGDGLADSVWLDLGFPAETAPDGRQFKPLFAVLCVDLDSRLNLNAHSSWTQLEPSFTPGTDGVFGTADDSANIPGAYAGTFSATATVNGQVALPRGMGFGPAEINLGALFNQTQLTNLLSGTGSVLGRYGETPGGGAGSVHAGLTGHADYWFRMTWGDYNNNYYNGTAARSSFASPPDVWGRGAVGVDLRGQPLYWKPSWSNEIVNNPYQINLSEQAVRVSTPAADNPFTVAELEAILRRFDFDATILPNRLEQLTPGIGQYKDLVTTDSFDVPVAASGLTREMLTDSSAGFADLKLQGSASVADLLRAKLYQGRSLTGSLASQATVLNADIDKLLDVDLIAGLRFNVNHPFGNGRDDDGDGIVDEPDEAATEQIRPLDLVADLDSAAAPPAESVPGAYTAAIPFDHDNDGQTGGSDTDEQYARMRYARQLFILAMLVSDPAYKYQTTENPPDGPSGQPSGKRELMIRRIAQWAVNAVDFRDADAIMTPFEYDVNPFNGWDVDGILGSSDDGHADRRLVWGCEAPELLLTETFAMHDRRVTDTNKDTTGKRRDEDSQPATDPASEDDDLDQVLIPQGSAFFELYCPRNANNRVYPPELYTPDSGDPTIWRLDLERMAPAGAGVAYPVWRMVITDPIVTHPDNDVLTKAADKPDSYSYEPPQSRSATSNMSLLPGVAATSLKIDRIVWFTTQKPTTHVDADRIYWARRDATINPNPYALLPSQYALIGPRKTTAFGCKSTALGTPSGQKITLSPYGLTKCDGTGNSPASGNEIQPPLAFVVAGDVPSTWTNPNATADHGGPGAKGIGISISEPLYSDAGYYPEPTGANLSNGSKIEAYGTDTNAGQFLDTPLDSPNATNKTLISNVTTTGLQPNLQRTVFLQRLADPTSAYNANTNPYLTVDWMPIDLTVFNGLDTKPSSCTVTDPLWDPQATNYGFLTLVFATRERGNPRSPAAGAAPNLWSPLSESPAASAPTPVVNATLSEVFGVDLIKDKTHTLGYLNSSYHDSSVSPSWLTDSSMPAVPTQYYGAPLRPFPWLTWNNRPFVSPLELMQVPGSAPSRLCKEFSTAVPAATAPAYGAAGNPASDRAPFGHLLNFFHDLSTAGSSPHLHRIFDYLRVPSPFTRSETILNPSTFTGGTTLDGRDGLHAPFNRVSKYREPGRLNINTMTTFANAAYSASALDAPAYRALRNGYGGPGLGELCDSMRGAAGIQAERRYNPADGAASPTAFANPFRSSTGALHLLPNVPNGGTLTDIDVTMLRAKGTPPDDANPLFSTQHVTPTDDDHRNTERNSQFHYEQLQRLPNLVTTRSNVYAIWVTMGYFEVEPAGVTNNVHPDGYRLKQELGADTGEITRHRAFYIYDRTIPVGYQRGQDLNIDQGTLLRRIIE